MDRDGEKQEEPRKNKFLSDHLNMHCRKCSPEMELSEFQKRLSKYNHAKKIRISMLTM